MKSRYLLLQDFTKQLREQPPLLEGMRCISDNLKKFIPADRASIFIYNAKESRLWSSHADDVEPITIPSDIGLIGQCIRTKKSILENEPYDNTSFLADIDMQTGYYTQNALSAPVFNSKNEIIAVLQLLNKKGGFSREDRNFIDAFAQRVSAYIEQNTP